VKHTKSFKSTLSPSQNRSRFKSWWCRTRQICLIFLSPWHTTLGPNYYARSVKCTPCSSHHSTPLLVLTVIQQQTIPLHLPLIMTRCSRSAPRCGTHGINLISLLSSSHITLQSQPNSPPLPLILPIASSLWLQCCENIKNMQNPPYLPLIMTNRSRS
jgi:hypothetical protein